MEFKFMHVVEKSVSTFQALTDKIETKTERMGIVRLGYVGLPFAVEFAKAGFHVTGIDLQQFRSTVGSKVSLMSRTFRAGSCKTDQRAPPRRTDLFIARELDTINICVPTPLRKTKDPDMSYIVRVSNCPQTHLDF